MGVVIALFNQKGGVGKTTTCANLCAGLALHNKKVLCVDFDPQSNLSGGLGINTRELEQTVYDVICGDASVKDCIVKGNIENLYILPSSIDLAGAEVELANVEKKETVLKRALAEVIDDYDYILIDCPPSLSLLPINALAVSSKVLIPAQCEYYALEGVSQLINTVNLVKRSLNPKLDVIGVLLTMFDSRTNLSHQVASEVKHYFGNRVFNTIIPRNVRLAEAPSHGMTIFEYDKSSKGATAYLSVADELIKRVEVK